MEELELGQKEFILYTCSIMHIRQAQLTSP